jgi:HPt (histidine-containing phosphotransfer) domain-containing protein
MTNLLFSMVDSVKDKYFQHSLNPSLIVQPIKVYEKTQEIGFLAPLTGYKKKITLEQLNEYKELSKEQFETCKRIYENSGSKGLKKAQKIEEKLESLSKSKKTKFSKNTWDLLKKWQNEINLYAPNFPDIDWKKFEKRLEESKKEIERYSKPPFRMTQSRKGIFLGN